MTKPNIDRLLELQQLLLQFSQIDRVVQRKHSENYRLENDTEHSYNLAMTAMFLAPSFPELDVNLLIKFALIHDLVEIHAGDTYAFASEEILNTKIAREAAAQKQLAEEWADFPMMNDLIERYEHRKDKEAAFIYALDKLMPVMQIFINEGYTWKQEKLSLDTLHAHKKEKVAGSPEITAYYEQLIELLKARPDLIS